MGYCFDSHSDRFFLAVGQWPALAPIQHAKRFPVIPNPPRIAALPERFWHSQVIPSRSFCACAKAPRQRAAAPVDALTLLRVYQPGRMGGGGSSGGLAADYIEGVHQQPGAACLDRWQPEQWLAGDGSSCCSFASTFVCGIHAAGVLSRRSKLPPGPAADTQLECSPSS